MLALVLGGARVMRVVEHTKCGLQCTCSLRPHDRRLDGHSGRIEVGWRIGIDDDGSRSDEIARARWRPTSCDVPLVICTVVWRQVEQQDTCIDREETLKPTISDCGEFEQPRQRPGSASNDQADGCSMWLQSLLARTWNHNKVTSAARSRKDLISFLRIRGRNIVDKLQRWAKHAEAVCHQCCHQLSSIVVIMGNVFDRVLPDLFIGGIQGAFCSIPLKSISVSVVFVFCNGLTRCVFHGF
jgi:hypothetical protein